MQLKRRIRLQRNKGIGYFIAAGTLLLFYTKLLPIHLNTQTLTSSESCPACYSQNLCSNFKSDEFELVGWDRFSLAKLLNERNVFQAVWKPRSQAVVLKKLGTDRELINLDNRLCNYFHSEPCDSKKAVESLENLVLQHKSNLQGLGNGELSSITLNVDKLKILPLFEDVDVLQCVSDQNLVDFIVHNSLHHRSLPHIHNLLTVLLVNQEPVISMIFPQSRGWPFPDYYGGCGRLAVFQYIGQPLDSYYNYSWVLRAYFALQLLKLAQLFSKNKYGLALYPTDWSANNFAVDWSTKQLYLVDMENIILVNQTRVIHMKAPGWDIQHAADRFGCADCFSFHTQDLCTHAYTDHNYHGVCGGLLSKKPYSPGLPGGLLHSTPTQVLTRYPELLGLIEECALSSKPGGREQTAKLLIEILQSELQDVNIQELDN
eukprot:TRINITY_DN13731_c0_g1_i1.p1 TRINITY_DN13731_c0_g1~~TRINITY_DN13731_c0_g1_i1.p1  ORF type:complete len:431 (-),score=30.57 TRINITY_DN13731_c0_g1_i1:137-1429(-)